MTMNPRTYWNQYADKQGGATGVACRLGIPYSTIAGICNGSRGIGRALARRMAEADPSLDEAILVWVEASKESANDAEGQGVDRAA